MRPRTPSCEEALRLLAEYLDGEARRADREQVERHLATCRSCYSRMEFEKRLKAHLAELRRAPVSVAFEQRIRSLIQRFDPVPQGPDARRNT